jgi:hypothetical protein
VWGFAGVFFVWCLLFGGGGVGGGGRSGKRVWRVKGEVGRRGGRKRRREVGVEERVGCKE